MILKQLTVKNYGALGAETQINFNTTGVTVLFGDAAASLPLTDAINWALYGRAETQPHIAEGETLSRAILGSDGKEMILTRRSDGTGETLHPVIFGFREDSVTAKDAENTVAAHHSPVWNADVFSPMSLAAAHTDDVLRKKILSAHIRGMDEASAERLVAEARGRMASAFEKQANQTIMQFRFLCDDNDIGGWERFGCVKTDAELNCAVSGEPTYSEKYLYSMLLFLAEVETIRKTFSKNYCDFIILRDFLADADEAYFPAAAYFLSRFRQQAIVTCGEATAEKLRTLFPPETVWYRCSADSGKAAAEKIKMI